MMRAMSEGELPMQIEALTDSYSIFSYLAAAHLKLPAEKSTYFHLAFLREKLMNRLIRSYNWIDTRDMVADGLTKGSSDRTLLSAVMDGSYILEHAVHEYIEPAAKENTGLAVQENVEYVESPPVSRGCSATSVDSGVSYWTIDGLYCY